MLLAALPARAAPFLVQLGEARIGLDAPPGFADTSFTGSPRLQELAESFTSPSNRILLFAISDGDLRKFTVGDPPEFRRFMLAVTPKALEHARLDRAGFGAFVASALRELGGVKPLGELRRDAEVVSLLFGAQLPPLTRSAKPKHLLSTTTLMLVRGKALNLSVYGEYEAPADDEWIRATTERWIEELQRLNSR